MKNLEKKLTAGLLACVVIVIFTDSIAGERERATYVGEGRYVGEGNSVGSAILRQRNNEWTQRQKDRSDYQRSQERIDRLDREYERSYDDYDYRDSTDY